MKIACFIYLNVSTNHNFCYICMAHVMLCRGLAREVNITAQGFQTNLETLNNQAVP